MHPCTSLDPRARPRARAQGLPPPPHCSPSGPALIANRNWAGVQRAPVLLTPAGAPAALVAWEASDAATYEDIDAVLRRVHLP